MEIYSLPRDCLAATIFRCCFIVVTLNEALRKLSDDEAEYNACKFSIPPRLIFGSAEEF